MRIFSQIFNKVQRILTFVRVFIDLLLESEKNMKFREYPLLTYKIDQNNNSFPVIESLQPNTITSKFHILSISFEKLAENRGWDTFWKDILLFDGDNIFHVAQKSLKITYFQKKLAKWILIRNSFLMPGHKLKYFCDLLVIYYCLLVTMKIWPLNTSII